MNLKSKYMKVNKKSQALEEKMQACQHEPSALQYISLTICAGKINLDYSELVTILTTSAREECVQASLPELADIHYDWALHLKALACFCWAQPEYENAIEQSKVYNDKAIEQLNLAASIYDQKLCQEDAVIARTLMAHYRAEGDIIARWLQENRVAVSQVELGVTPAEAGSYATSSTRSLWEMKKHRTLPSASILIPPEDLGFSLLLFLAAKF